MNDKTTTIIDLKAQAYDALANIEAWQHRLREINEKIAEMQKSEMEQLQIKKAENE